MQDVLYACEHATQPRTTDREKNNKKIGAGEPRKHGDKLRTQNHASTGEHDNARNV